MKTFEHINEGDIVIRKFADHMMMTLLVTRVYENLIYSDIAFHPKTGDHLHMTHAWTFDRRTGAEEDFTLGWGMAHGVTGSHLVHEHTLESGPDLPRILSRLEFLEQKSAAMLSLDGEISALVVKGEAEGAIPNRTRVRKRNTQPGDSVADGGLGTIYSSIIIPIEKLRETGIEIFDGDEFAYFIIWDDFNQVPVFTRGFKVEVAQ